MINSLNKEEHKKINNSNNNYNHNKYELHKHCNKAEMLQINYNSNKVNKSEEKEVLVENNKMPKPLSTNKILSKLLIIWKKRSIWMILKMM